MIKVLATICAVPLFISTAVADMQQAPPVLDRGDSGTCQQSPTTQLSGTAAFDFFVTVEGVARDVRILKSSGDATADTIALKCVETARYKSTTYYDKPDEEVWAATVTWSAKTAITVVTKKQPSDCAGYYPPEAIAAGAQGTTKFSLRVTSKGWTDVKLLQSSGNVDLDEGAILCVAKRNLDRALRYGAPADTDWEITIAWVLDPSAPNPLPPQTSLNFNATPQTLQMRLSPLAPGKELYMHKAPSCDAYYPAAERARHVEGVTVVGVFMTREGKTENVSVKRSSGFADLDEAAVKCYETAPPFGISGRHNMIVIWSLHDPLIPAGPFKPCTSFYNVTTDMLKGIPGTTLVSFLLMPNGSVGRIEVSESSGDQYLDQAAMTCVRARQFDTSKWILPSDGMPEFLAIDWRKELAPPK